jgi:hypothetical protein
MLGTGFEMEMAECPEGLSLSVDFEEVGVVGC